MFQNNGLHCGLVGEFHANDGASFWHNFGVCEQVQIIPVYVYPVGLWDKRSNARQELEFFRNLRCEWLWLDGHLCGAWVLLYGAWVLLCGAWVLLYGAWVLLYGAWVLLYGEQFYSVNIGVGHALGSILWGINFLP